MAASPHPTLQIDAGLLQSAQEHNILVQYDPAAFNGMGTRVFTDGSIVHGGAHIITAPIKDGKRYYFNYSACSIIQLYQNAPLADGRTRQNRLDVHLGLCSPSAVVLHALELGWDESLPVPGQMLEADQLGPLGEILEVGIKVILRGDEGQVLYEEQLCKGSFTITLDLQGMHFANSGDSA